MFYKADNEWEVVVVANKDTGILQMTKSAFSLPGASLVTQLSLGKFVLVAIVFTVFTAAT